MRKVIGKRAGRFLKRGLAVMLMTAMLLGMCPALSCFNAAFAADELSGNTVQPVVVVSGTGIIEDAYTEQNVVYEKSYTLDELKALEEITQLYSAINTNPTKSIYLGKGISIEKLLQESNITVAEEVYAIDVVASDGYTVRFDPDYNGNSMTRGKPLKTPALGVNRFFYPNIDELIVGMEDEDYTFDNAEKAAVGAESAKTILAWERGGERGQPEIVPEETEALYDDEKPLLLMVGQQNVCELNNPLFNKTVSKVIVGDPIEETAITIDGEEKTRSDILMMERADREFTYNSSGGSKTDYVRGVPLSVLLEGYGDDDIVGFTTADNYPAGGFTKSVAELKSGNYILAYEKGSSDEDLTGIYETAKNDDSIYGFFTLYGDGEKPYKLIDEITVTTSSGIDFANSPYKHINNGGITGQDGPYDIDAITGATLTIEGPGVETSVPLPIRELENQNAGAHRDNYTDVRGGEEWTLQYEGIRLSHIVHNMTGGANGIRITENAHRVLIKNRVRQTIAEFTLDQIETAENADRPIIIAYGTGTVDETVIAPFVYDLASGFKVELDNDDGPIKLVYDKEVFGDEDPNPEYTEFGNVAYIYIEEESSPGYKHDKPPYDTPENSQYVLTITGDKIGREVNYTVQQLEDMVEYDDNGEPVEGGMGYRDEYSMSNSTYWYVNEYEGVQLWKLLLKSGLPANIATGPDKGTIVSFTATDNYKDFDKFTVEQISNPDLFKYYEKSPDDENDGKYTGNDELDLRGTGYPVLVAYGVNSYPYVIDDELDGFMSGLSNDGGPLRIISGKTEYSHANGSKQAKLLDKVIVGDDLYYSTHKYNPNFGGVYQDISETSTLNVRVISGESADGTVLKDITYTVGELEDIIYGGSLTRTQLQEAKIKGFYEVSEGSVLYNDLYEGINLIYFLEHVVELPGYKGTITFSDGTDNLEMSLEEVLSFSGCNKTTNLDDLSPVLAYAKNGTPMVEGKGDSGYESTVTLAQGTEYEHEITVKNNGGPLAVLFPLESQDAETAESLNSVTSITINLLPDHYAHTEEPYSAFANNKITVFGEGTRLTGPREFTVSEIEGKQTLAVTGDYNIKKSADNESQLRYRGIPLYDFLASTDVGLKPNADKVIVTSEDGASYTFSLAEVYKSDYINGQNPDIDDLQMILAYGSASVDNPDPEDGKPLVQDKDEIGYEESYGNSGGPIRLVVGQTDENDINSSKIIKNVISIEVTASDMVSWNHSSSPIYEQYLDDTFIFQVIDNNGQTLFNKTYTVGELESMTSLVEREDITWIGTQTWEGINLWDFVIQEAGSISGITDPISVNVYASDGFNRDLRSTFGMDALENGIRDGESRIPIIIGYAVNGYPLVPDINSPGHQIANDGGPLRLMTHGNQGSCLKQTVKIIIKVGEGGTDPQTPVVFDLYPADGSPGNLPMSGVRSIWIDEANGLWVSTYGGGVAYKPADTFSFTVYNKASDPALATATVSAVAVDKDGGVWMSQDGSYTIPDDSHGVAYMKDGQIIYYSETDEPKTIPDNFVRSIQIDENDNIWFGTYGGLTRYNPNLGEWTTWDHNYADSNGDRFPAVRVDTLLCDGEGGVWVGFVPDGAGTQEDPRVGGFAHMTADGEITPYKYIVEYDDVQAKVWVRDIAIDKAGGVWVVASGSYKGTPNVGGTVRYVDSEGQVTEFDGDELLGEGSLATDSEIRMVTVDPDGDLWFGTSEDGVFYIEDPDTTAPLDVTAQYSSKTGSWSSPLCDNIYSLDFVEDTLYVGSSGGLAYKTFEFGCEDSTIIETFTISGVGTEDIAYYVGGPYDHTIKGLEDSAGKVETSYKYNGETHYVKGAYLSSLLADAGAAEDIEITIITSDGYTKDSYKDIPYQEILLEEYFVAYDVGEGTQTLEYVADTDDNGVTSSFRIYRNHDSGEAGSKENRIKCVVGIDVADAGGDPGSGGEDPGEYDLTIEGKGVSKTTYFTVDQLKNAPGISRISKTYDWLNNWGTRGSDRFEGAYMENLLDDVVGLKSNAKSITVTAKDGYERSFNLDSEPLGVYWTDIQGNKMMLAWKQNGSSCDLKLVVGQTDEDHVNKPMWVSDVEVITVNASSTEPGSGTPGRYESEKDEEEPDEADNKQASETINVTLNVKPKLAGDTAVSDVSVSDINKAIDEIKDNEPEEGTVFRAVVEINAVSGSKTGQVKKADVNLTAKAVESLAKEGNVSVAIKTDLGEIVLSPRVLEELTSRTTGDIKISITSVDDTVLKDESKDKIGDRPIVDIVIAEGNKEITGIEGNQIKAATPYESKSSDNISNLLVYYVDEEGDVVPVKLSKYDQANNKMVFETTHLSLYAVGLNEVSFNDVQNHWAKNSIEFLAARTILKGKGEGLFDPNGKVTRAEFVTMLAGSIDIDAAEFMNAGFDDVAVGAWYSDYVNWAVSEEIVKGYGNGKFGPNDVITREQMAVMTDNFIKAMQSELDVVNENVSFKDQESISNWAAKAVANMQQHGIINGRTDGTFDPQGTATRAEAAAVIKGYIDALLK
jgi:hypothetical protein